MIHSKWNGWETTRKRSKRDEGGDCTKPVEALSGPKFPLEKTKNDKTYRSTFLCDLCLRGLRMKLVSSWCGGEPRNSTRGGCGGRRNLRPHSVCRFLISRPFWNLPQQTNQSASITVKWFAPVFSRSFCIYFSNSTCKQKLMIICSSYSSHQKYEIEKKIKNKKLK